MHTLGNPEILIGCDVTHRKPLKGFPPGRVRVLIRHPHDEVIACVRDPEGLRTFLIAEKDGHWMPVLERCQGNYRPLPVNPVNTVNPVPPPPARVLPDHGFDDFTTERGITWSNSPAPTSSEKALAIIILAAAIGFVLFIFWILSFS